MQRQTRIFILKEDADTNYVRKMEVIKRWQMDLDSF